MDAKHADFQHEDIQILPVNDGAHYYSIAQPKENQEEKQNKSEYEEIKDYTNVRDEKSCAISEQINDDSKTSGNDVITSETTTEEVFGEQMEDQEYVHMYNTLTEKSVHRVEHQYQGLSYD